MSERFRFPSSRVRERSRQAMLAGFGAMSRKCLAAVDRVVGIVRELDRDHGPTAARGTESRRKLLKSLVSGAGTTARRSSGGAI